MIKIPKKFVKNPIIQKVNDTREIYIDDREPSEVIDNFNFLISITTKFERFKVIKKHLLVGDVIYGDLGVERKTIADFIASIHDGRIFEQAFNMSQNFKRAVITISGELSESTSPQEVKSILSSIADIQIRYNIQTIFCMNEEYLAYYILNLCFKIRKDVQPVWHLRRAMPNIKDEQVLVPIGIKGIGIKTSMKLLTKFRNLRSLFNADYETLQPLLKSKASHFIEVVTSEYPVLAEDSNEEKEE